MSNTRTRSAFDLSHVKSVKAAAILKDGKQVGRVVANFSDNPAGSVCTCTVVLWDGNRERTSSTGRAGGYGYDKYSSAAYQAMRELGLNLDGFSGGDGRTRQAFEANGYEYMEVL